MHDERVAHYISELSSDSFPKRFIYLDTESISTIEDGWQVQRFRIASASCDRWSDRHQRWIEQSGFHFTNTDDLWDWVSKFTIKSHPTVLWCHNLGFDVRISRALLDLPSRGWHFDIVRLGEDLSWMRCKTESGKTLIFCDTVSWFATSIENMGRMLGMNKAVLPENDDDDLDKWFERCDADVEILATAWRKIRDWMTSNDLGSWKMTGASQGWTVWRRRFYTHKVLVHDDEKSLLLERAASYAGRAEGFRYGKIKGRATEFDYRHSYASTCAHANVPTRKVTGQLKDARSKDQVFDFLNSRGESAYQLGCSVNRSAIVDATVHVEVPETGDMSIPVLPFRTTTESGRPGKIIWPQGTFRGQWWLPELLAAEQAGQLVDMNIHSVTQYICEPALSQWANWAISVIDDSETPPIIAAVVKQWTRTLVGRFGLRYVEYSESNIFPGDDTFQAGAWIFGDRKNELSMNTLQIGEQIYISSYTKDGSESSPQIMSYVMMLTRLRLLEAMQAAGGIDNVLYCDTDGFIVNEKGSFKLRSYADLTTGYLRKKSSYTDLFIYGPKQLIIEGKPRVAGLPSRPLQRNDDGSWKVEKWERTRASLESGRVDTVRVRTVDMHIAGANGRRSIVENDDQITQTLRVEEEVSQ